MVSVLLVHYRCGHCKRLIPTWDELGKLHNQDRARQDITIAKVCIEMSKCVNTSSNNHTSFCLVINRLFEFQVDCTVDTALCSDHGVTGYPT
jgi:hypothetical protein